MFWDKKRKDEGLPELPRSSSLPTHYPISMRTDEFESEDDKIHELPAFPDSPMRSGFSQAAIKEAVAQEEISEEPPEFPTRANMHETDYNQNEMEEWKPKISALPESPQHMMQKSRDNKPIFVRIDKYQIALGALDNVKTKLTEIEELMKQIREVKNKEDQELSSWETEMETIKARIQTVMSEVFDKTDY